MQSFVVLQQVVPIVTTGLVIEFLTRRSAKEPKGSEFSPWVV